MVTEPMSERRDGVHEPRFDVDSDAPITREQLLVVSGEGQAPVEVPNDSGDEKPRSGACLVVEPESVVPAHERQPRGLAGIQRLEWSQDREARQDSARTVHDGAWARGGVVAELTLVSPLRPLGAQREPAVPETGENAPSIAP